MTTVRVLTPQEVKKNYQNWEEILEEEGWWFENGEIVVVENENKVEELKTILHEVFEFYLEVYFGFKHEEAHGLALKLEDAIDIFLTERNRKIYIM